MRQTEITLPAYPRGFHSITNYIEDALQTLEYKSEGVVHVFIKHTSASICINEDADPTVREDFESYFNKIAPENAPYFKHDYEGSDDMCVEANSNVVPNLNETEVVTSTKNLYYKL